MTAKYILGQMGENGKPRTIEVEEGVAPTTMNQNNSREEEMTEEELEAEGDYPTLEEQLTQPFEIEMQ